MIRDPLFEASSMAAWASAIDSEGVAGNLMLASAIENRFKSLLQETAIRHRTVCSRRSQPSPMPSKWPKIQSPLSESTVNSAPSLSGLSNAGS
jgi:hypothetical protein